MAAERASGNFRVYLWEWRVSAKYAQDHLSSP